MAGRRPIRVNPVGFKIPTGPLEGKGLGETYAEFKARLRKAKGYKDEDEKVDNGVVGGARPRLDD